MIILSSFSRDLLLWEFVWPESPQIGKVNIPSKLFVLNLSGTPYGTFQVLIVLTYVSKMVK